MEKITYQLGELIENDFELFNFDYPFYSEEYRKKFEEHFIDHFYFDEIGQETPARFRQRLNIKLNLIMPYWNKILIADGLEQRILDNYDVTETFTKEGNNKIKSNTDSNLNSKVTGDNKNLFSDNGITKTDIDNVDFLTSITKDVINNNTDSTGKTINNVDEEQKEQWTRKMSGNIGIQTDANAIVQYWQSLRKIEEEIFKECEDLFMGVY